MDVHVLVDYECKEVVGVYEDGEDAEKACRTAYLHQPADGCFDATVRLCSFLYAGCGAKGNYNYGHLPVLNSFCGVAVDRPDSLHGLSPVALMAAKLNEVKAICRFFSYMEERN